MENSMPRKFQRNYTKHLHVTVDPDTFNMVRNLADQAGEPIAVVVRQLIRIASIGRVPRLSWEKTGPEIIWVDPECDESLGELRTKFLAARPNATAAEIMRGIGMIEPKPIH
jgi:hypothetical protein